MERAISEENEGYQIVQTDAVERLLGRVSRNETSSDFEKKSKVPDP